MLVTSSAAAEAASQRADADERKRGSLESPENRRPSCAQLKPFTYGSRAAVSLI